MKITELPEEYIVQCNQNNKYCNDVIKHYYVPRGRDIRETAGSWKFIICRKDISPHLTGNLSGNKIENFIRPEYKNMPLFSYEEWKELISEFVLPKRWCIFPTKEQFLIVREWAARKSTHNYSPFVHHDMVSFDYEGNYRGYEDTRITFEQFQKYVLKQEEPKTNNMKKPFAITGSVALKEAFVKEAGLKPLAFGSVPDYKYLTPYSKNVVVGHSVLVLESIEFSLPKDYDEALKYVKTYWEEEFNVGDWIVVENSNKLQNGCTGCPQGIFQIVDKDKHIHHNGLLEYNEGFYVQIERAIWRISKQGVRKATKEEIEEARKACNLPEMSTYKAEIKEGKLHYGCKSFSKQDVQAIINAAAVLEKFSSYGASLSSTEVKTSDSSLSIEKLKTILNKLS